MFGGMFVERDADLFVLGSLYLGMLACVVGRVFVVCISAFLAKLIQYLGGLSSNRRRTSVKKKWQLALETKYHVCHKNMTAKTISIASTIPGYIIKFWNAWKNTALDCCVLALLFDVKLNFLIICTLRVKELWTFD